MQTITEGVATLIDDCGVMMTMDTETTELLATNDEEVFTHEDISAMPYVEQRSYNWDDAATNFSTEKVKKKLNLPDQMAFTRWYSKNVQTS